MQMQLFTQRTEQYRNYSHTCRTIREVQAKRAKKMDRSAEKMVLQRSQFSMFCGKWQEKKWHRGHGNQNNFISLHNSGKAKKIFKK